MALRVGKERSTFLSLFRILQADVRNIARSKGWYKKLEGFPVYIAMMHSELSEALKSYRDKSQLPPPEGTTVMLDEIGEEFADVVIRIMDTAEFLHIDLASAILRKVAKNRKRPYRHGGKAC